MTTTINTGHPLMNTNDERTRIRDVLKHLGSGADLRDFPATASEKVALVKTASQRKLIVWHKGRGRYELTPIGWCELAPSRRFGIGSMLFGSTAGATIGAAALGAFWVAASVLHGPASPPAFTEKAANLSSPAVTGALANSAPLAPVSVQIAAPAEPRPAQAAAPAPSAPAAPAAAPVREAVSAPVAEPTRVVEEPTAEQLAQAAKAKQAAAVKKARQRAAARRRREEAARAWAATEPSRTRQAEYSGYGGFSGYGGQGSWFAYR